MSLRKIHIANKKARNAIINFKGHTPTSRAYKVDENLNKVFNRKIIKGVAENTLDGLKAKLGDDLEKMADLLMSGDPEIDYEVTGRFLGASPKVYINEALKVVYRVNKIEKVFDPNGALKEERELRQLDSNITNEVPLKWSGKYFKIDKYYNKFVFVRTYQLFHDSGLTYDTTILSPFFCKPIFIAAAKAPLSFTFTTVFFISGRVKTITRKLDLPSGLYFPK